MSLIGLDTNILVYAEGVNGAKHRDRATELISALHGSILLPLQVCCELHRILVRKAELTPAEATGRIKAWVDQSTTAPASRGAYEAALSLAGNHRLQIWDALILAVCAEAGCRLLLSEDMQHGFVHSGLTVVDPFRHDVHPLLADTLRSTP
jgi:predicted nucleic acid-binding protein